VKDFRAVPVIGLKVSKPLRVFSYHSSLKMYWRKRTEPQNRRYKNTQNVATRHGTQPVIIHLKLWIFPSSAMNGFALSFLTLSLTNI